MTSNPQPPDLDRYLARRGFRPHPGNSTWLDHRAGQHIIRVAWERGEQTELICLTPHIACLYKAAFSSDTPDAVTIAAVDAVLSPPQAGRARTGRARASRTRTKEGSDLR